MSDTYIGEFPVDLSQDPVYSNYQPKDWALLYILKYGSIDGAHHKDWVLDQVARILNGAPVAAKIAKWTNYPDEYRFDVGTSAEYDAWVLQCKGEFDPLTGHYEYGYSEGIPP